MNMRERSKVISGDMWRQSKKPQKKNSKNKVLYEVQLQLQLYLPVYML